MHSLAKNLPLVDFLLFMGDNCLILGHRLSAWCGHAPVLEEDIAVANISLDLIGQTQLWLSLAANAEGAGKSDNDLAFKRDAWEYRNALLVEQKNGDFAHTLMRQFLFDAWHLPALQVLRHADNRQISAIAEKAAKEVTYHVERSRDLIIRLGDGTEESHQRLQNGLNTLWPFTGDLTLGTRVDQHLVEVGEIPDMQMVYSLWQEDIKATFGKASLVQPESAFKQTGGREGRHTEELGYVLAEMQFLPRAYPNATW